MMESVLRKFRLRKERRESEARQKLKKELFSFNTCVGHGFPSKPSALAFDPKLQLLAIGTRTGDIGVYGAPGVEFYGQHPGSVGVAKIHFLPGQGRLITVCADSSLHLWQINESDGQSNITLVKSVPSNVKTVHASCITSDGKELLLGINGGALRFVDVLSMKVTDRKFEQDSIVANAPEDFKTNPGTIVDIAQHPTQSEKFLIGYSRGIFVLWDNATDQPIHTYSTSQQLESLSFYRDGNEFVTAHADGSYIVWDTEGARPKDQATTPYGPFPCKSINKLLQKSAKPENYIIFSGGMPRASHGDKHTVSVMQGNNSHVVFDLTSKVIDFLVLCTGDEFGSTDYDDPHTLVILTEEELVAIDLTTEGWLTYKLPYLNSIHSSAILSASHVSNVPEAFWDKLVAVGAQQFHGHSTREWPINGGINLRAKPDSLDLLLTGHEDGSVRFWDVSTTSMRLIYKLSTSGVFGFDTSHHDMSKSQELEDEWPPFRKVGTYDPYSDDPQLGIQRIAICCRTETLILGGTAGQIIVLNFSPNSQKQEIQISSVSVVGDNDNYVWKGHDPLSVQGGEIAYPPGFQPSSVVQLYPPSLCTSLAVQTDWRLLAIGTAFGYAVFDYLQNKQVYTKCTLSATGEGAAPRRRSFRRSIRESFRRLRGRRTGQQRKAEHRPKPTDIKVEEVKTEPAPGSPKKEGEGEGEIEVGAGGETSSPASQSAASPSASPKHVEPKPDSRTAEDLTLSIARCIYFADTFLLNAQDHGSTLWVGTNAGTVFIHQIVLPSGDKRGTEAVTCTLAKEIQLRHGAPVILVSVVDRSMLPLSEPHMLEQGKGPDMSGNHQVVICSEEQFKLFSLPNLKPSTKYKLTQRDGTKVLKANIVSFKSKSDEHYVEHDLACLTNAGQIHVFTVPQLRSQLKGDLVGHMNTGINAGLFTVNGEGFILKSVSEFSRLSLSARHVNKPACNISLVEGSRPPLHLEETERRVLVQEQSQAAEGAPAVVETVTVTITTETTDPPPSAALPHGSSDDADADDAAAATSNDLNATAGALSSTSDAHFTAGTGELVPSETLKMSMSESSSSSVVVRNVTSSRTVVTKTTVSRTTDDGGTVTETSTNVQHLNTGHVQMSGGENMVTADGAQEH